MFKKSEPEGERHDPPATPTERRPTPPTRTGDAATIGPSICIRGDLTGEEDLVVQGKVEGTIGLGKNLVTIGRDGQVSAAVHARVIVVEGRVEGDLNGDEQVILKQSATVQGNIVAPRVTLEDGCHFKGSIDMDVRPAASSNAGEQRPSNVAGLKTATTGEGKGGDQQVRLK